MESPIVFPAIIILVIALSGEYVTVHSNPNTNITSVLCNSSVYSRGDPFAISLAYVLEELERVTPSRPSHDYYNISPFPNAFAYGHASCGAGAVSATDCSACLLNATDIMRSTCNSRIGARSVLYDCEIRYEQYPFTD